MDRKRSTFLKYWRDSREWTSHPTLHHGSGSSLGVADLYILGAHKRQATEILCAIKPQRVI